MICQHKKEIVEILSNPRVAEVAVPAIRVTRRGRAGARVKNKVKARAKAGEKVSPAMVNQGVASDVVKVTKVVNHARIPASDMKAR